MQPTLSKNIDDNGIDMPVLMYHHLSKSQKRLGDYVISPEQFEQDLLHIKNNGYETISSTQLLNFVENAVELPKKPIMITFDDGYESVFEYAFPLLKKYEMKAVFLPIGKHTDIFSNKNEPRHINYSHASWEQICEMQKSSLIEIGNHTYNMHDNISGKRKGIRIKRGESLEDYEKALQQDINEFQSQILKETGKKPIIFAYPFGASCKESEDILQNFGFKIILTCQEKVNRIYPKKNTPIYLNRFNRAHHYSTYEFFNKIKA
ncbi:MAG: polysaccharide deacetylase family protein [Oscillospiraceae bacterium]